MLFLESELSTVSILKKERAEETLIYPVAKISTVRTKLLNEI